MSQPCQQTQAIKAIETTVLKIEHRLFGNGQPGIESQLNAKIEKAREVAAEDLKESRKQTEAMVVELHRKIDAISTQLGDKLNKITVAIALLSAGAGAGAGAVVKAMLGGG